MMYSLAYEDGSLGDFANGQGLRDFRAWVEGQDAPILRLFLEEGVLDLSDIPKLRTELAFLRSDDPWVNEALEMLREGAKKAQEILILSDGESDEEESIG
jgi:hypothetical protein